MSQPDAGDVFDALADPTRRRLLDRLSEQGPASATDLAGRFPVSRQAIVKHLSAMAAAGLVGSERRGREVLYGVRPDRLRDATAWLDELGRRWDRRVDALVRHLSDAEGGAGS